MSIVPCTTADLAPEWDTISEQKYSFVKLTKLVHLADESVYKLKITEKSKFQRVLLCPVSSTMDITDATKTNIQKRFRASILFIIDQ